MNSQEIIFSKNNRAKRYIIRILQNNIIRVTIPKYGTKKEAEKFFFENIDKLQKQINKNSSDLFELNKTYHSKFYNFKITHTKHPNTVETINKTLLIKITEQVSINSKEAQEYIIFIIEQILRKEAKRYIPRQTMEFATRYKLKVSDIKINSAKTRWGSCSVRNSLNFSLSLMQLPFELIDYVILHELSHIIHKNHSKDFYILLNKLSNNKHLLLNKELKQFSTQIRPKYFEIQS